MLKGFEDAFMDAQVRIVSLTLELLDISEIKADKIYIYIYQNDVQKFFNAFFEKDKVIYRLNDWFSDDQIYEYFDCGEEDIDNIIDVCDTFDGKCPHEFKLIYNIKTKAFDSKYNYDDILTNDDKSLVDIYHDWVRECKDDLNK